MVSRPEVVLVPDHAPEAVHESASVVDQVRSALSPKRTEVGATESVIAGSLGCVTVRVADFVTDPPAPVQVKV